METFAAAAQCTEYSYKVITKLIAIYRKYKAHDQYWEEVKRIVEIYLGVRYHPLCLVEDAHMPDSETHHRDHRELRIFEGRVQFPTGWVRMEDN